MGTIPQETIEQIAAANDIVEVIGSYFPLKRAGANFKALCPFHQEKTPSFIVSPGRQTFHCFGCGAGGSVFRFVMDYEHVDFPAAVRKLAARAGIAVVAEYRGGAADEDRRQETRRILLKLHAEAAAWFHENLLQRQFAQHARNYLERRGIPPQTMKAWQLGFSPESWDAFLTWALAHGYTRAQLVQGGLVKLRDESRPQGDVYDRFRGRIMFPICNDLGEVIAFSGRILKEEEGAAKYLNSPETPLFRKGEILFGLHKSKRALIEANCAIVCEGQLDLISLFEAGIRNVVAPQGTAFTDSQARVLKRFVQEVILCFDADAAGQKAAERSLDALFENDLIVRVAEMPPEEDPDSLVRREGVGAFEKRIAGARDFFDYWIERETANVDLRSLSAKVRLAHRAAEIISRIHDPIMRGEVVNRVSARLGVASAELKAIVPERIRQSSTRETTSLEPPTVAPDDTALLCLLALRSEKAHRFLKSQNWREVLAHLPYTYFLQRILESGVRPNDSSSLSAFMSTLPPEEEQVLSGWLLLRTPSDEVEVPWQRLRSAAVRRQLAAAQARLRAPGLTAGEITNLQKEIVDLRQQLHELSQPAGPTDN
jgi:DNA primase